jgi:hypothetical protein
MVRSTLPPSSAPTPTVAATPKVRFRFFRAHKLLTALVGGSVVAATAVLAAVLITQEMVATPNTRSSPVQFVAGDDAASLDALDFIGASDPVISASGAAATFTVYGIPGATSLSLGEVVDLQNPVSSDAADYKVTLSVSGAPSASLTAFTVTFVDDVDGILTPRSWDLLTQPALPQYTLDEGESWEFTVSSLKMSPTASGSQGALTIGASITPA